MITMKNEYDYLNDVKMDFSIYDDVISEEEVYKMKNLENNNKRLPAKKFAVLLCAAVLVLGTGVTAATGGIDRIIKNITTGHNIFTQMDPNAPHELPDALKGKFFTADGEPLDAVRHEDMDSLYNSEGKLLSKDELEAVFKEAFKDSDVYIKDKVEESEVSFATIDEAKSNIDFALKVPAAVPEGFEFSRCYSFTDEDGSPSSLYMNIEYVNAKGEKLVVHERLLNDETAYRMSTDGEMEEVDINGRKAVIIDGRNIDFETEDDVSVAISTHGLISRDELINMAKSIA